MCVLWLLSHSTKYCWARAMSSWNFCLLVCFQALFTVVFLIPICVLENSLYVVMQSILLKMFLWKKKTLMSLKFSEVFVRAALRAGRCSGLCLAAFGQLYLELSLSLSMTVVLTEAK